MELSINTVQPSSSTVTPTKHVTTCCTITQPSRFNNKKLSCIETQAHASPNKWEPMVVDSGNNSARPSRLGTRWMEYQGMKDWEGLLDPLDDNLRREIIRYGYFVDATYRAFDFDTSSPWYATCRFEEGSLLSQSGFPNTGYRITENLHATSGIQVPHWINNTPRWMSRQSSWIGYVAVCDDQREIARLGRRDVVVAYRGTATCLEWLENLRATLTNLPKAGLNSGSDNGEPMVESGFLSLYTSKTDTTPSLQQLVREEIKRLLQMYGDEPISLTITGHSLGAALATLTAYDLKTTFNCAPLVTVTSFGGPRVGNRSFRHHLEKCGVKVLRIVNSDDLITKVPGFVIDTEEEGGLQSIQQFLSSWIRKRVEDTQWAYADVGRELRLRSRDSPELAGINVAACHDLKTYLHLVNGFVSSKCPFRATAIKRMKNIKQEHSIV